MEAHPLAVGECLRADELRRLARVGDVERRSLLLELLVDRVWSQHGAPERLQQRVVDALAVLALEGWPRVVDDRCPQVRKHAANGVDALLDGARYRGHRVVGPERHAQPARTRECGQVVAQPRLQPIGMSNNVQGEIEITG